MPNLCCNGQNTGKQASKPASKASHGKRSDKLPKRKRPGTKAVMTSHNSELINVEQ